MRRRAFVSRSGAGSDLRAAALLYGFRLFAGLVVAYPAARAFSGFGAAPFADGDRALFEPGGFRLLEALRFGGRTLALAAEGAGVTAFVLSFAGLFPLAAAITALTRPGASLARSFEHAIPKLPAFALFFGAAWLARAIHGLAALILLSGATAATGSLVDERAADLLVAALGAVLALGLVFIDVLHDLARLAVVRFDETPAEAARSALQTAMERPGRLAAHAAGTGAVAFALVAVGAALTSAVDVARPGGARVAAVFAVHQLVVFGVAFTRARWLSGALDTLGGARFSASGAPGTSGRGLAIDLDVPAGGPVPGQVQPHDPAA